MLTHIQRRLMPQTIKVRSEIEIGCYAYEGVEAIKTALRAGMAIGTEEMPIKINLIAAPRYVVTTTTIEKEGGVELLKKALTLIENSIKEYDGIFNIIQEVKIFQNLAFYPILCQFHSNSSLLFFLSSLFCLLQPKVVTELDEKNLEKDMENAERENAQRSGDDDSENSDAGGDFSE